MRASERGASKVDVPLATTIPLLTRGAPYEDPAGGAVYYSFYYYYYYYGIGMTAASRLY